MTFAETGIRRAGLRNTVKGVTFSGMWAIVHVDLAREPALLEVADWWNMSRAQAFRYQQAFRLCWPHLKSPWEMTERAIEEGLSSEKLLKKQLKHWRSVKRAGIGETERGQLADEYAQLVGLAIA